MDNIDNYVKDLSESILKSFGEKHKGDKLSQKEINELLKKIAGENKSNNSMDGLTGCIAGSLFNQDFEEMITKANDNYTDITLILADVDGIKAVNDTLGHTAGDEVLKVIANHMKCLGAKLYRYSGDSFAVLLPGIEKEQAFLMMEKVRQEVAKEEICVKTNVTISAGIATYIEDGSKLIEIIRKAGGALYRAKTTGKNKVSLAREEKLVTKTTHYTVEQLKKLKELSLEQSIGEAELMREALDDLLKKYDDAKTLVKTVLLVDDAAFMRTMQKDALIKEGFKVVGEAEDGKVAIELFTKLDPDFTVLDIVMPEMDGLKVLKNINKQPKNLVIMCTAMGQKGMFLEAVENDADDFVVKPFQMEKLLKRFTNPGKRFFKEKIETYREKLKNVTDDHQLSQAEIDALAE